MKKRQSLDELISEQWPKLKKKAHHEKDTERLMAILEEIDDLLFKVEMRIAPQSGQNRSRDGTDAGSARPQSDAACSDDTEIGSQ
jgi:hypothetical protein